MRILDVLLLLAIIIGSYLLTNERYELANLDKELTRANAAVGDMVVEDENILHVRAINGEHPGQWAWRVYLPKNCQGTITHHSGGGSGSHGFSSNKEMLIARCSIAQTRAGTVGIYFRFGGGSSFSTMGSAAFYEFVQKNFDRLSIEQFGKEKAQTLPPGSRAVTFLKVSMPDQLAQEAQALFGEDPNVKRLIPDILTVNLDLN